LALIAPLLGKALRGRSSALKRKAARVIDNMCRLVKEPADVAPFMPLLLPALDKVIDEIVDAEVRSKSSFLSYLVFTTLNLRLYP
jgi:elongation factor 3